MFIIEKILKDFEGKVEEVEVIKVNEVKDVLKVVIEKNDFEEIKVKKDEF